MKHSDYMKRLNDETNTPPSLMEDFGDPGQRFKDADKRAGFVRYEFKAKISSIRNAFSKLFGGKS